MDFIEKNNINEFNYGLKCLPSLFLHYECSDC